MYYDNNADRIKKRLLIEVAKLAFDNQLAEEIDRLPLKMFPQDKSSVRCCIYKDRAISKYRLMAILGFRVEDEQDELAALYEYVQQAEKRTEIDSQILTVIDQACSACLKGRHFVTNVCKGCVARPCMINCPKDAVSFENGKAKIEPEKCVNCGLCLKVCPYHAIAYVPIPCEEACPVDAISKDEFGHEHIDPDKCIHCGNCMSACPFGAIMERSQIVDVISKLKADAKVVAMLAPAMAGQFPVDFHKVAAAAIELGFDEVVEVALGAEVTASEEAKELNRKIQKGQPFMTSSCCPAYTQTVEKHIPQLKQFVSDTPTPMHYTARYVKENDPDAITVFIGPCIAKRVEAAKDNTVDHVLTTDEFGAMLVAANIELENCTPVAFGKPAETHARNFAVSGGVSAAIKFCNEKDDQTRGEENDRVEITPVQINGIDKKSIKILKGYANGKCPGNFLEVMSCQGGCVAGPCSLAKPQIAANRVSGFAKQQNIKTKV